MTYHTKLEWLKSQKFPLLSNLSFVQGLVTMVHLLALCQVSWDNSTETRGFIPKMAHSHGWQVGAGSMLSCSTRAVGHGPVFFYMALFTFCWVIFTVWWLSSLPQRARNRCLLFLLCVLGNPENHSYHIVGGQQSTLGQREGTWTPPLALGVHPWSKT